MVWLKIVNPILSFFHSLVNWKRLSAIPICDLNGEFHGNAFWMNNLQTARELYMINNIFAINVIDGLNLDFIRVWMVFLCLSISYQVPFETLLKVRVCVCLMPMLLIEALLYFTINNCGHLRIWFLWRVVTGAEGEEMWKLLYFICNICIIFIVINDLLKWLLDD